jgi:iron complex outermembrane receptor protein
MKRMSRLFTLPLAVLCLLANIRSVGAQQPVQGQLPGAQSGTTMGPPQALTITVTAEKLPIEALSLPLSVTALPEDVLRDADIRDVKQASALAPNVLINEFTARAVSNPYFRGVGGSPSNPGVSTFIDGVPQLNGYSSNIEFLDVRQIEFVRGPEGALYGRNTAAGVISIVSRRPSGSWAADVQGSFASYRFPDLRVSVSGPLAGDRVAVAVSGGYSARDGYTRNTLTGHAIDDRAAGFGKIQLLVTPTDRLTMRLLLSGERDRDGDYALVDLSQARSKPHIVSRDFEGFNRRDVASSTLLAEYRARGVDLASITGGVRWKHSGLTDLDYQVATLANGGLAATRSNDERQFQFTQEFRAASSADVPVRLGQAATFGWQAGLSFFAQRYQQDAGNDISSAFGFFPRQVSRSSADLNDAGAGVYAKGRLTAWKRLDVSAGVRFDHENKRATLGSTVALSSSPTARFSEVSPQFGLAFHVSPMQVAYASVARGYKAGGFNPPPAGVAAPSGTTAYGTEHTWSYELGYKARWWQGRFETTVAAFRIDWTNLQLNQQIPFSGGQYYVGNAGTARSQGLEVEARLRPIRGWDVFGSFGSTRARFTEGSIAYNANLGVNQAADGHALPYAPDLTASLGTQATWTPSGRVTLYGRFQVTFCGDFKYDASNAEGQARYSLAELRAGVRMGKWFAEGWVDNAFDTRYVPIAIPYAQLGAASGYVGESGAPRRVGIRAGVRF